MWDDVVKGLLLLALIGIAYGVSNEKPDWTIGGCLCVVAAWVLILSGVAS